MSDNTRIKININTGEIEFEGSEEFVISQLSSLPTTLNMICDLIPKKQESLRKREKEIETGKDAEVSDITSGELIIPDNFGEWLNKFPPKMQQTEQMLIAGYFHQNKLSPDNMFKTIQANKLLIEQGVKVSNPADCMLRLKELKRVFVAKKDGKLNLFRVSKPGEDIILKSLNQ